MKKEFFLVSEIRESTRIRLKFGKPPVALCENCGTRLDQLSVDEAAEISGTDPEKIRESLRALRVANEKHQCRNR
ncbi:MAG: hypothetical protein OEQ28_15385 [Acidobacteriota bacterium]|nr:hypothetical protein [Acidobacteriota bacterium]